MAELRIDGLAKAFGAQPVLRGLDLRVPSAALVAILGASGSGKTTLLRVLCGFEREDAGRIAIDGRPICGPGLHVPPERRHIGYVAQDGALFPHLSVADNILFGLKRAMRRDRARVGDLLEMVGLPPAYAGRPPHELSGGEQQRVALARALAPAPRLILLDEPFSGLDAALRVETRQAVAAALAASRATAILVTHDQSEALSMGTSVAVLRQGRLVQMAHPETLYRHPADVELARFVGEAVVLAGDAAGASVVCPLGRLPLAPGMPSGLVEVMVRPEQIRLAPLGDVGGIRALVCGVTYYGHDASVRLRLVGGEPGTVVTARVFGHASPRPGEEVGVSVEGEVVVYRRDSAEAARAPDIAPVPGCPQPAAD